MFSVSILVNKAVYNVQNTDVLFKHVGLHFRCRQYGMGLASASMTWLAMK